MSGELQDRARRFADDVQALRIEDPAPGRHGLWVRVGAVLMVLGLALAVGGAVRSASTTEALRQRDALALGVAGVAAAIVGAAVYLRASLTKVLRFWLARIAYEREVEQ